LSISIAAHRLEPKPLGLVWVNCPYPMVALGLKEILKTESHVHLAQELPAGSNPSSIIFCPDKAEDPAQEIKDLQCMVPEVPIVVFCPCIDPLFIRDGLRAGARGFVHFDMEPAQILRVLSLVSKGETVVPNEVLRGLMEEDRPNLGVLSPRQREILEVVAEGLTNAQIGERLYLSEITIKQHLRAAYKLLGVRNRVGAVMLLKESG
jgi:DNA-binding NarL/FixJ family response regulator